jgi:hypothetical protein
MLNKIMRLLACLVIVAATFVVPIGHVTSTYNCIAGYALSRVIHRIQP